MYIVTLCDYACVDCKEMKCASVTVWWLFWNYYTLSTLFEKFEFESDSVSSDVTKYWDQPTIVVHTIVKSVVKICCWNNRRWTVILVSTFMT